MSNDYAIMRLWRVMTYASLSAAFLFQFLATACIKVPDRFAEGYYTVPPSGYFAGETFEFRAGRFTRYPFTDVGEDPAPDGGRYEVSGTRIKLDPDVGSPRYFDWRIISGVHLLLDHDARTALDQSHVLVGEYWILCENRAAEQQHTWWPRLLKTHKAFSAVVPEQMGGRWKPPADASK